MARTKQKKYDESEVYIIKGPENYDVIDAASDIDKVESRKFGNDHVIVINGRQLREIDKRKLKYESWIPDNGKNPNDRKIELRK